jgi:hypothetical protein
MKTTKTSLRLFESRTSSLRQLSVIAGGIQLIAIIVSGNEEGS